MKLETKKPQPSEFRQDLLRGIRWGTILLIAMLLTIAAYRVLSSTAATASETQAKGAEALTPAVVVVGEPEGEIKVAEPVLKGPDAPPAPEAVKVRKAPMKAAPQVMEAPQHLQAPHFAPLPNTTSKASTSANSFVAGPLPDADTPLPGVELPSPRTPAMAPPPDGKDAKQENRAVRAVRSVGRIFRLGRKDTEAKQPEPKK